MAATPNNRFAPHRWTLLTWLAVLIWAWQGVVFNVPAFESRSVDPATGAWLDPIRYQSLTELPYPVGWPLAYVRPDDLSAALTKPWPVGAPPPVPGPSTVHPLALVTNVVLIAGAIAALVYCLQKSAYRYGMGTMAAVLSAVPLYYIGGRLAGLISAAQWWPATVFFSPVPLAIALRVGLFAGRPIGPTADRACPVD